jgi:UDP-N-acetylglucosamine/UDP-N-acetylgalactosamine 4-epimerase
MPFGGCQLPPVHHQPSGMNRYQAAIASLKQNPRTWLITGVAGFIGSNLLECLLSLGQAVVGLDNFSTGHPKNIDEALEHGGVGARFRLIYGDTRELSVCREACQGVDVVLHQAALGSVPRSLDDPIASHASNVDGFMNMLVAARDAKVSRFVYASSSAVYGDDPALPKREERIGEALSPYAATKVVNEIYAAVFKRAYGLQTIGLRYFNVFGRRQDPQGPYAAVIPKWVSCILGNNQCTILGDGETGRDFCHIDNVVQANLLAATIETEAVTDQAYNVACGNRTTLNELFTMIRDEVVQKRPDLSPLPPLYSDFRPGDVRNSLADVGKINRHLGYVPTRIVADGIGEAIDWYIANDKSPPPHRRINLASLSSPALTIVPPTQTHRAD